MIVGTRGIAMSGTLGGGPDILMGEGGGETLTGYIGDTLATHGGINLEKLVPDATYHNQASVAIRVNFGRCSGSDVVETVGPNEPNGTNAEYILNRVNLSPNDISIVVGGEDLYGDPLLL